MKNIAESDFLKIMLERGFVHQITDQNALDTYAIMIQLRDILDLIVQLLLYT